MTADRSNTEIQGTAAAAVTNDRAARSWSVDADSEAAWVAGLRRGEPAAFDAVFAAYRARIYGYLARMTGRRDLADDLVQEVFLRLARRGGLLTADTRLGPWLFTVAHNLIVSHARAARVAQSLAVELGAAPTRHDPGPFEALAGNRAQLAVEAALAAMPPAHREVLLLCASERLSPAEAATVLGVRPDLVRQRLSRARAQIESALALDAAPTHRRSTR